MAENLFTYVCYVVGVIFIVWSFRNGKKKDRNPKEYRKQDPVPFDEIP